MTDTKRNVRDEIMWLADRYADTRNGELAKTRRESLDYFARQLTDRIAELEAQLEAVGAGGIGAMLPRHAQPEPAVVGPVVAWRYQTPTGWHATTDAAAVMRIRAHHTVEPLYTSPQQIAEPESEPMLRFCPSCGSCGPVPAKFRDCCPDGSDSRVIPAALANKCRNLFQLAIAKAITKEPS